MELHSHTYIVIIYLALAFPAITWFVLRRHHEPIRSRVWELSITSAIYGGVMAACMAVAAEIDLHYGSTPCSLIIWPMAPFTCFFLNFNHRWTKEKLRQSRDAKTQGRLDWFQKNKWRVRPAAKFSWVWVNAVLYLLVAVMYEYINASDPLPNQWLPFDACLANTRYMVVVLAAVGTFLLAGTYATFYDITDAFFFKKELAVIMAAVPVCYVLWAVQVFALSPFLLEHAHSAYYLYAAIYAVLFVSILLPLALSIRQGYIIARLKQHGVDHSIGGESTSAAEPEMGMMMDELNGTSKAAAEAWAQGTVRSMPKNVGSLSPKSSQAAMDVPAKGPDQSAEAVADDQRSNGSRGSGSKRLGLFNGRNTVRGSPIPPRTPTSKLFGIMLVNDGLRTAFQRYCMESWCIENYLFYRDGPYGGWILTWTRTIAVRYRSMSDMFRTQEALRMAETYLPTESTLAVNLPADIRDRILKSIQDKDITSTLFQEAEQSVMQFMRDDTFLKWRTTDAFQVAWRQANIPAAMLLSAKQTSPLTEGTIDRIVVELSSTSSGASKTPLVASSA